MLIKKMIAVSLLLVLSSPLFASVDWSNENGNAARTNSLAIHTKPSQYRIEWTWDFGTSYPGSYFVGSPIIADHILFVSVHAANSSRKVYVMALNATTGGQKWGILIPQADNNKFYQDGKLFVSEYLGTPPPFHILTLDTSYGEELSEQPANIDMYYLTVDGMTAYGCVNENNLAGYDLNTNQIVWMEKLSPGRRFGSSLSLSKDYIVSPTFDGFLVFNRRNGKLKYKYWIDNTVAGHQTTSVVMDATTNKAIALFTDDDLQKHGEHFGQATLIALNLDKQTIAWKLPMQQDHIAPAFINHTIFSVQFDLSQLNAVDTESGQVRWSWQPPDDDKIHKYSKLVATSDVVFIATTKRVYAVSQSTHQTVWQTDLSVEELALGEGKLFMFSGRHETNSSSLITAVNLSSS